MFQHLFQLKQVILLSRATDRQSIDFRVQPGLKNVGQWLFKCMPTRLYWTNWAESVTEDTAMQFSGQGAQHFHCSLEACSQRWTGMTGNFVFFLFFIMLAANMPQCLNVKRNFFFFLPDHWYLTVCFETKMNHHLKSAAHIPPLQIEWFPPVGKDSTAICYHFRADLTMHSEGRGG